MAVIPDWAYLHFLDQLGAAIDSCNEALALDRSLRWAVCFDEVEIVPDWLREEILALFRSADQRFLFKVTGSPFESVYSRSFAPSTAQPWHDVTVIKLWYTQSWEPVRFCERLARSVIERTVASPPALKHLFGTSPTAGEESPALRYSPSGSFWASLRRESRHDRSLEPRLKVRGIDINNPGDVPVKQRDEFLRKIRPILLLREEFRKTVPSRRVLRSRRQASYYSGIPTVLEVSDGNPRWLIGMLRDMLQKADDAHTHVTSEAQARVIAQTSRRFRALLRILPGSVALVHAQELSLVSVLEKVGRFFSDGMLKGDLPIDPLGSFRVDEGTREPLLNLIRLAVSQGALVQCDDEWKTLPASPAGKRFRLSFLLAPSMKLPLRLYDSVLLSECLGTTVRSRSHTGAASVVAQQDLFSESP